MKRFAMAMTAASLAAMMLAGCGETDTNETAAATESTAEAGTEAESAAETETEGEGLSGGGISGQPDGRRLCGAGRL
ncbi:MAG: hypothetical protein ACLTQL_01250 [Eisenbergiella sp.]